MTITLTDNLISLSGMLDSNSAPDFEQTITSVLADADLCAAGKQVVLDLSGMTYTSSQGLRLFLTLQKGLTAKGAQLVLRGVQPAVMEVLQMTGFTSLLTIE